MFGVTNAIYVILPIKKASMQVPKQGAQLILRPYGWCLWRCRDLTETFSPVQVHIGSPPLVPESYKRCQDRKKSTPTPYFNRIEFERRLDGSYALLLFIRRFRKAGETQVSAMIA